ncbi:glycosyltransferase family 4 protein [Sinomicrobium soli]|uniref:glycosyltransferase family 4 protein n=1 Tax=Sinomicrobium sp. N-1-3-6 TaxID=2219864 RepID=UPI000DCE3CD6|nr:glycosyltransferase family 4 protein [Sinomicrobium sp. N-1-3-6]RAV30988.1 hypothetical protein DN748_01715 [Sinomicrobium sp. N-1-3-6]
MSQKTALHINSYFLSNKIHYYFYKQLLKKRNDQFLIPVYKHFKQEDIPEVDIDYVFGKVDKAIFVTKILKVVRLFYRKKYRDFDYLHGHTLISDGIPTFILSLLLKKEFVVSVRITDISLFIRRSVVFKYVGRKILSKAKAVFFISPSLKSKIEELYPDLDSSKYHLMPNGLAPYWLEEKKTVRERPAFDQQVKLLFVGKIIPRKNIDILIKFLEKKQKYPYELTVAGENVLEMDFNKINSIFPPGNKIKYLGKLNSIEELRSAYDNNNIFVLLSLSETFGAVYTEALSRGLPIVYTRGEGVDGFFEEGEVGFSCSNSSVEELQEKMEQIILSYRNISTNAYKRSKDFDWDIIVHNYLITINNTIAI